MLLFPELLKMVFNLDRGNVLLCRAFFVFFFTWFLTALIAVDVSVSLLFCCLNIWARLLPTCSLSSCFIVLLLFSWNTPFPWVWWFSRCIPLLDVFGLSCCSCTSCCQWFYEELCVAISLYCRGLFLAVGASCCYNLRPNIFDECLDALLSSRVALEWSLSCHCQGNLLI